MSRVRISSSARKALSRQEFLGICLHGGLAERRGSGLQSRIHGFESRTHLGENHVFQSRLDAWAIGAAVARFPDTEEVTGSIPVSPTRTRQSVWCGRPGILRAHTL